MITASKLTLLSNMPTAMLTMAIQSSGYKQDNFLTSSFVGLSNGNQFVYNTTFGMDNEIVPTKVYITYDPSTDKITADY